MKTVFFAGKQAGKRRRSTTGVSNLIRATTLP
jgi:hypothetical protein